MDHNAHQLDLQQLRYCNEPIKKQSPEKKTLVSKISNSVHKKALLKKKLNYPIELKVF